jgi:hypothetical protein
MMIYAQFSETSVGSIHVYRTFPRLRHNEVEEEEVIQVAGENTSTRPVGK